MSIDVLALVQRMAEETFADCDSVELRVRRNQLLSSPVTEIQARVYVNVMFTHFANTVYLADTMLPDGIEVRVRDMLLRLRLEVDAAWHKRRCLEPSNVQNV